MADQNDPVKPTKARKTPVKQSDVPSATLTEALRVAQCLADEFNKGIVSPLDLAVAMNYTPTSGPYRAITGASVAYGLTEGAAQSAQIGLGELGRRIVSPMVDGDDMVAKREAFLRPRVIGEFLRKYDGGSLPSDQVAKNVLEQIGVPSDSAAGCYDLIRAGADELGLLADIKGKKYVRLSGAAAPKSDVPEATGGGAADVEVEVEVDEGAGTADPDTGPPPSSPGAPGNVAQQLPTVSQDRVFITHGSNKDIVEQIKEILTFGKFVPVVSIEKESVAKPVPDKVLDDMRSCYAGIVHVGTELRLLDEKGNEHNVINPNVLIEIGAAMALYGRRFILLVERGVKLPSNLQGLYEVRYDGDKLDHEATMKLLRAFNEFRET
jgi:hypothetical protein